MLQKLKFYVLLFFLLAYTNLIFGNDFTSAINSELASQKTGIVTLVKTILGIAFVIYIAITAGVFMLSRETFLENVKKFIGGLIGLIVFSAFVMIGDNIFG